MCLNDVFDNILKVKHKRFIKLKIFNEFYFMLIWKPIITNNNDKKKLIKFYFNIPKNNIRIKPMITNNNNNNNKKLVKFWFLTYPKKN